MKGILLLTLLLLGCIAGPLAATAAEGSRDTEKMQRLRTISSERAEAKAEGRDAEWAEPQQFEFASSGSEVLKGLGFCIGVFLIGAGLYKRLHPSVGGAATSRIQLLERRPITSKTSLVLIEIDGAPSVVAVGPEQVTFHAVSPWPRWELQQQITNEEQCEQERAVHA